MLFNVASIVTRSLSSSRPPSSTSFEAVVMPRATGRRYRISFYYWRTMWHLWPRAAWRVYSDADKREDFLAVFAPFMMVSLIGFWIGLMIFGFALVLWGVRGGVAAVARFVRNDAVLRGHVAADDRLRRRRGAQRELPRLISILAALAGLSFLSIMTAFLFAVFGSFQQRETFVVTVAARAGTPPSGVNLLAIAGYSRTHDDLAPLMIDAQRWAAAVMESHLAYPVLAFFRSSHDDQSWVGTLGTLLDAATLMMTTIQDERDGQARIFYNVGRHATRDLSALLSRRRYGGFARHRAGGVRPRLRSPRGGRLQAPRSRRILEEVCQSPLGIRRPPQRARAILRNPADTVDRRPLHDPRRAARRV